jgi:hypothetical protein
MEQKIKDLDNPGLKNALEILEKKENWVLKDLVEIKINPHFKNITNLNMWVESRQKTNKELALIQNLYLVEELIRMLENIDEFKDDLIDFQYCHAYIKRAYDKSKAIRVENYKPKGES